MVAFRNQLPESYKTLFGGTDDWTLERRARLVEDVTADQGLTLLKLGISRLLLLRALFSSERLEYSQRHKALEDGASLRWRQVLITVDRHTFQRSFLRITSSSFITN
jgi:hypothetical protein